MGVVVHEAMIVTCWNQSDIGRARDKAVEIFTERFVSQALPTAINTYSSFLIQSSGSKQGWEDSASHRQRIRTMQGWLEAEAYDDGSNSLEWVVVQYGNDLDGKSPAVLTLASIPPDQAASQQEKP